MKCILCGGKLAITFEEGEQPLRACEDDGCPMYHEWLSDLAWQALVAHSPPPKLRAVRQETALRKIRFLASRAKVYTETRRLELVLATARKALR